MKCGYCGEEVPAEGLSAVYADEDTDIIEVTAECRKCGAKHFHFIGEDEFDWER